MRAKVLTGVLGVLVVAGVLFVAVEVSYAPGGGGNQAPVAVLVAEPNEAVVGYSIELDGSDSSDDGMIVKYEWDFNCPDINFFEADETEECPEGSCVGITEHAYDSAGTYTVAMRVSDDGRKAKSSIAGCVVSVSVKSIYHVDPNGSDDANGLSWGTAFATVQKAIGEAVAGDEIWVMEGAYKPTDGTDWSVSFELKEGLSVYGGFAGNETELNERNWTVNETILSGDIGTAGDANDNSYHVVIGADKVVLDGFTIMGGNADGGGPDSYGGGMYCSGVVSLTVKNCLIKSNRALSNAGGMYNDYSEVTVEHCSFTGNGASDFSGGGVRNHYSETVFTNCVFSENSSDYSGGGFSDYDSNSILTGCSFSENSAPHGGAMLSTYSNTTVINCSFNNNSASSTGGAIRIGTGNDSTFVNCAFINNAAAAGGAIFRIGGEVTLTNCTLAGNEADIDGGGIWDNIGSKSVVTNCILWSNKDTYDPNTGEWLTDESAQIYGDVESVTYSCIQDANANDSYIPFGGADSNNIDDDPVFADAGNAAGGDGVFGTWDDGLQLGQGSPCLDMADSSAEGFMLTDITGRPRVDIWNVGNTGAGDVPYADAGFTEMSLFLYVDDDAPGSRDGRSWPNAYHFLQDALEEAKVQLDDGIANVTIYVAEGTYRPDLGLDIIPSDYKEATFELIPGVTLRGGYAGNSNPTNPGERNISAYKSILDGDIGDIGTDDLISYHVVTGADAAVIEGFTITGGYASVVGHSAGGGMYNHECSPEITKCEFIDNFAAKGGAIYNCGTYIPDPVIPYQGTYTEGSSPTITDCTFIGNETKDGVWKDQMKPVASDCGAIMNYINSSPTIKGCVFSKNYAKVMGGAMGSEYFSSPKVEECFFIENESGYTIIEGYVDGSGGAVYGYRQSHLDFTNCVFTENKTMEFGGGIYLSHDSYGKLTNCTFAQNRRGGIYACFSSRPKAINCIFAGGGISDDLGSFVAKINTFEETTISSADPMFVGRPIAYWRMDDNTDDPIVLDLCMNDGLAIGGGINTEDISTDGRVGKALSFDGNCYIWNNDPDLHFDASSTYTWMGWFKADNVMPGQSIIYKDTEGSMLRGFSIDIDEVDSVNRLVLNRHAYGVMTPTVRSEEISPDTWYHFAITTTQLTRVLKCT